MPIEDFPGNSQSVKRPLVPPATPAPEPEEPVLEPVVTGKVIKRKTPLGRRVMKMLFSGDTDSVGGYLLRDVLIPAIQATVTDVITQGIQRTVYGDSRPGGGYRPQGRPFPGSRSHISYNDRYNQPPSRPTSAVSTTPGVRRPPAQRDSLDIGEIIIDDKIEAEIIIEKMLETVEQYGVVTVGQLYNLTNQTSVYTDHRWGWNNLGQVGIRRVREGYLLMLPPPIDLGR